MTTTATTSTDLRLLLAEEEAAELQHVVRLPLEDSHIEGIRLGNAIWVLPPTPQFPLRYQYAPGWGPHRLISRDEASCYLQGCGVLCPVHGDVRDTSVVR